MRTHRFIVAFVMLAASIASYRDARGASDGATGTGPLQRVVAGERYGAGGFHRFLLGDDYRNLWTTPIDVPELDLRAFAGGLRPVMRVGGQQTLGLAMKGADGRDYTFRGLDKDPSDILPPEYQGTIVDRLLQDQIASSMPGGALAVSPILDAAGVLHVEPILVVMPDDTLLGEFRETFAGVVGTFEVYPRPAGDQNPGFADATEIINGATMWERMDAGPDTRPDARAFLQARLVDLLVGDWDRHRGQWRWAKVPGDDLWQPIPEDRDQAFVRFEGLIPAAGRERLPQFVSFGDDYPDIEGLTWNGRDGDRRILVGLEKPVWDETAAQLRARVTDDVIAEAVARLPRAYQDLAGADLERALRKRRDALPEITDRFYRFLARDVDVHLTAQDEHVTVEHRDNGDVNITVGTAAPNASLWYQRTFRENETKEVRIYLGGGDDTVVTSGASGGVTVRVIASAGVAHVDDSAGTGLRLSGAVGTVDLKRGKGTHLDTRPYTAPPRETAPWIPPRDWGHRSFFFPWIGGNSDLGVLFLGTYEIETYGFRKDPFAARHTFRLGYATRAGAFGGDYHGQFHHENTRRISDLYVRISGLDVLHFYGFGNQSSDSLENDHYKVKHTEYVFRPAARFPFGKSGTASAGVQVKYSKTDLDEDNYIATAPPYGSDDFLQAGAVAGVELDSRDVATNATRGHYVVATGAVYPPVGQVESTFGEINGEAAVYWTAPVALTPTLALRAGGKKVWGPYPWHEAAYVGGVASLRGFASQRYAGDASAYGSAELRIPLTRIYVFVPGAMGIFGLGDVGRVFLDGETSDEWHTDAGGGLWFWFIQPENTISIFAAASDEGTRFYLRAGLGF